MKRLILFSLSILFMLTASGGTTLYAQSNNCDPIKSGLNYGADNLRLSQTCKNQGTTTGSNGSMIYAAMGDSVAAGLGLNGAMGDSRCGQTSESYPYLVAQQKGYQLIDAACSGATVGDIVTNQGVSGPNIQAQLDQAYARGTPQVISITAGANDMQWLNFLRKCYASTCGTATDSALAKGLRTAMETKYSYALGEIQRRSNGHSPRVVVTGYYNPISNYCKNRQAYVSNQEINWLNQQRDELNRSIRKVASKYSFVRYASTDFTSHTICAKEPWAQGINDPAPLHPTVKGQQMIAKSILGAL